MSQFSFIGVWNMKTSNGYLSTYGNDHVLWGAGQGNMQDPVNAFNVYATPNGTYIFQSQLNGMYLGLCANSELACCNIPAPSQAQQFVVLGHDSGFSELFLPEGPREPGTRKVPEWLAKRRQETNWSWKNIDIHEHLVSITAGWNLTQLPHNVANGFGLKYANLSGVVFPPGSDFTAIDLSEANLDFAILDQCNLTRANFTNCSLNNVSLNNATVNETIFNQAKLNRLYLGTTLWKVKANGAILNEANLSESTVENTELRGATLNGANLSSVNLVGSDLSDATFNQAKLTKAFLGSNFSRAILNEADLSGATLAGADFTSAKLNKTNLTKATLTNVKLSGAILDEANFTDATLTNADLTGASLKKTILTNTKVTVGNFSNCDLTTPVFNNTTLVHNESQRLICKNAKQNFSLIAHDWQWIDLQNATVEQLPDPLSSVDRPLQATGANLSGLNLKEGVKLSHAILDHSVLDHLGLSNADLSDASLISASLHESTLTNVNLHKANLTGAQLGALDRKPGTAASMVNAYMPDANLTGANLYGVLANNIQFYGSGARLDGSAILEEAQLNNSNLSNMNLTEAQLRGTNLSGSHLFNVKFNKANLSPSGAGVATNLSDSNLQGADFTDAQLVEANLSNAAVAINVPTKANPKQGGVYLFSLPYSDDTVTLEQYKTELSTEPLLEKLRAAFKHSSLTLSSRAMATVDAAGQRWLIDNDSENPKNFKTGYVKFIVKLNGSVLDVYGIALRILRLGENNQEEFDTESCQITILSQTNMNAGTVLPNGVTLSMNQSRSGKSWDTLWLRASAPPRPPDCVPTGTQWCPPPKR